MCTGADIAIPYVRVATFTAITWCLTIASPRTPFPGRCRRVDQRLGFLFGSQPHESSFVRLRTGSAIKRNAGYACLRTRLSHHHRDSHRTSDDEHHLFAPSPRHRCLSGLQARAARRRSRGRDTRRPCGRICRTSAFTDNSDCCDDGLTAIGQCTRVHDGAGH